MLTVRYRVVQSEALSDDASGRHSCFTTSTAALMLIAELAYIESFNLKHYLTMLQPMHTSSAA